MKKHFALFLVLVLAFAFPAFASVQLLQDGAELGHVNKFNCSTGTTCAKVGDQVNVTTAVGTIGDIRSGSIYGVTTLAFNGAVGALNTWRGVANGFEFEGATADAYETTISAVDPTADQTISIPTNSANSSLVTSLLTTNNDVAANSIVGVSNGLRFEGATADDYETTIAPTDATADRTITLPNLSGTAVVANASYASTAPLRFAAGTIVSGQTAIAITMTGNAATNKCIASAQEAPTNAGYIKNVVAGTDNVTVTVNTDPGASNLDVAVMCWN